MNGINYHVEHLLKSLCLFMHTKQLRMDKLFLVTLV
jgi:hypothetical protein